MITLKNVKFSEHLSEETNAFTADVYFNGKKIGYAKNSGHGGETSVMSYGSNVRDQFKEMETFTKTLPPIVYGTDSYPNNLESEVDQQFEAWLSLRDLKKHFNKGIVYENGNGHTIISYPLSINQMKQRDGGVITLKKTIARLKSEGKVIVNTNLIGYL